MVKLALMCFTVRLQRGIVHARPSFAAILIG